MKNRILFYIVTFIVLLGVFSVAALADATLSIDPADKTVSKDEVFTLDVAISSTEDVFGSEINVLFDNSVLEATGVVDGGYFSNGGASVTETVNIDNVNGEIYYLISRTDIADGNVTGDGVLAEITFKANVKNGASDIELNDTKLSDSTTAAVAHSVENGTVNVETSENVVINEFLAHPSTGDEWIELYNNNSHSINLSGWTIHDNLNPIVDIPENTILGVGDLALFNVTNKLNNGGDSVILKNEEETIMDQYDYIADPGEDVSIGRTHDGGGDFVSFSVPTPNQPNNRLPSGEITDQTIDEDGSDSFNVTDYVYDEDGDAITFSIVDETTTEVDCDIDDVNITITAAANWNGIANCTVRADDGYGTIDKLFYIIVNPVNDLPEVTQIADIVFDEDSYDDSVNLSDYVTDVEDSDDDITWSYTGGANLIIDINNKILNVSAEENWNGEQNITLIATDNDDGEAEINVSVIVNSINDVPIMQAVDDKYVTQEETLSFTLQASDADNDNLTYAKDVAFGTLNETSGEFEWTPDNNYYGLYEINFSVEDDHGAKDSTLVKIDVDSTLAISQVDVEVNPAYSDISEGYIIQDVMPGSEIETTIEVSNQASAPNIDDVNLSLKVADFGVDALVDLGTIIGDASVTADISYQVPYDAAEGLHQIVIETYGLDHGDKDLRFSNFSYYINVTKEEDTVVISNIELGNETVKCLGQTNITVNVSNIGVLDQPDLNVSVSNDDLSLFAYDDTQTLAAGETKSFFFDIETEDIQTGDYTIEVKAVYYNGMQTTDTVVLSIENCEPQFNGIVPDLTIDEESYDDSINLSEYFTDINGDTLAYSADGNLTGLNFVITDNGLLNITLDQDYYGINVINLSATDGEASTGSNDFTVTVNNVNDEPVLAAIGDQNSAQDVEFTYQASASDVDDMDVLSYALTNLNASTLNINGSGYIDGWIPSNDDVGETFNVYVEVCDDSGAANDCDNETFTITVGNANDAPVFTGTIGDLAIAEDSYDDSINLSEYFTDPDGDELVFDVVGNLTNLDFDFLDNGLVNITPVADYNGENKINFTASDAINTTASNELTIIITPEYDAPTLVDFNPETTAVVGEEYVYNVSAEDIDEGDVLTFSDNSSLFVIDPVSGLIQFTPADGDDGVHVINITVTDNGGLTDSGIYTLNVYDILSISNVKVSTNGGDYEDLATGQILVGPHQGDNLKVKLDVKNWLTTYDLDLVRVNVTLEDGSTLVLNNEYNILSLASGVTETVTIDLGDISASVPNGNYDLIIEASAQYDPYDPKTVESEWAAIVKVWSDAHQIIITSEDVTPESVGCDRQIIVNTTVRNLDAFGSDQDITVEVTQATLAIDESETQTVNFGDEATFLIPINVSEDAAAGTYTLSIHAETTEGTSADTTLDLEVVACDILYEPADDEPIVSGKEDTTFSFTLPAELSLVSSVWKENGVKQDAYDDLTSYVFEAKFTNGDYHIRVEIEDDRGITTIHDWYPTASMYPIATPYTTEPDLSTLNETELQSVVNFTILNGNSKIKFLEAVDLSTIVALGDHVAIEGDIAAINSTGEYYVLDKPAQITLTGLSYDEDPKIFYSASSFTTDASEITAECPSSICKIDSMTAAPTTNGVVVFNVTGFSSYRVGTDVSPPPSNAPEADAGSDQEVLPNTEVTLDGSGSFARDGKTIVSYEWTQTSGTSVTLSNANSAAATFTPTEVGSYTFKLTVTDSTSLTDEDSVTITVSESSGADGNLIISDLDIKVGSKTEKNLNNGDTIGEEAKPGDIIKFDIEFKNTFEDDINIEDIEVEVTIEDIDDGSDLDADEEIDEIKDGKKENVEIEFTVPDQVEEDSYVVVIRAEGEDDENEESHVVEWTLELTVEKERHKVNIFDVDLSPSNVKCSRVIGLDVGVVNVGQKLEEDVELTVTNSDLGINEKKTFDLDEDIDDDDNEYKARFTFRIDDNVKAGTYPIEIEVEYDDGDESEFETAYVTVQKCVEEEPEEEDEEEIVDVEILPGEAVEPTEPVIASKKTTVSFRDSSTYLVLIAIVLVILIGALVYAIGAAIILLRR